MGWLTSITDAAIARWRRSTIIDVESLCLFRVFFGLFTILFLWESYTWIDDVPNGFYDPPVLSLSSLAEGFPPRLYFLVLDGVILVTAVTLTIGLFTRTSTLVFLVALIAGYHFEFSFGKIDHGILYSCVLIVMCFSDWGRYASVDYLLLKPEVRAKAKSGSHDLALLGVLVSFAFLTAGFGKALSWIDFDPSENGSIGWLYRSYYNMGRDQLLASYAVQIRPLWLWEIADVGAAVFEVGFFVALLYRRVWFAWLITACAFHLANTLMLNIAFLINVPVYLCFVPWAGLTPRLRTLAHRPTMLLLFAGLVAIGGAMIRLQTGGAVDGIVFRLIGVERSEGAGLVISALVWLVTAALLCACYSRSLRFAHGLASHASPDLVVASKRVVH